VAARATTTSRDEAIENECIEFVNAFYDEPGLDLDDFCDARNASRRTVQRALAARGNSWRAILTTARMREARKLLTTTIMTVKDIAEEVGYIHTKSFVMQYKRKYGEPPLATRKEARRGAR
jgi:two-component system response regulator YesN